VKSDIYHCNSEAMRKPIDTYFPYVIRTYKALVSHWPEFSVEELAVKPFDGVQPFFLTPKLKLKSSNSVWFLKTPVGKNTLNKICKELIEGVGIKAKGRVFSNKTPRRIGISRMEAVYVPIEKGMYIMGHRYFYFCCIFDSLVCLFIICYWFLYVELCLFRDHKNYAKYNTLDSDIDQKAC
jgi:hypothetical protein